MSLLFFWRSCSLFKLFVQLGEEEINYDFQYRFHVREVEQIFPQLKVMLRAALAAPFLTMFLKTFSTTPSDIASTKCSPPRKTTAFPSRICWICVPWCRTNVRIKWRRRGLSEFTVAIISTIVATSFSRYLSVFFCLFADYDDDGVVSEGDITKVIDQLTSSSDDPSRLLEPEEKQRIARVVCESEIFIGWSYFFLCTLLSYWKKWTFNRLEGLVPWSSSMLLGRCLNFHIRSVFELN